MEDEGAGSDGDDGAVDVDATSTNQTEISLGLLKVSDVQLPFFSLYGRERQFH